MGLQSLGVRVQDLSMGIQGFFDRAILLANELDLGVKIFCQGADMPFEVFAT